MTITIEPRRIGQRSYELGNIWSTYGVRIGSDYGVDYLR